MFTLGANEFTAINAFTNNSEMHDWSPLPGTCPLQVTFNWISKRILPDDSKKFYFTDVISEGPYMLWLNIS